jgi:NADPH:quinone reductase-like Zn-dependent oxidoreductase
VPEGVDVVLDVIGGAEVDRNLSVRRAGHHRAGRVDGRRADEVNLGLLLVKRVHVDRHDAAGPPARAEDRGVPAVRAEVLPLFESGALRPVIDSRFPLERIAEAHRYMEADANVGKILLDVTPGSPSA